MQLFTSRNCSSAILLGLALAGLPAVGYAAHHQQTTMTTEAATTLDLVVPAVPFNFLPDQLPHASGTVVWRQNEHTDQLLIRVKGLPASQNYTVFLTEDPNPTFGAVSYIADLRTDAEGNGSVTYHGEVKDAFVMEWGGPMNPPAYEPVNLDYVVIWPAEPSVTDAIFAQQGDNRRVRTPFDGDGEAGVAILTTAIAPGISSPLQ